MYIEVYSGLTSRIKTIMEAIVIVSQRKEKKLTVIWPLEDCCAIPFWDVFDRSFLNLYNIEIDINNIDIRRPENISLRKELKRGHFLLVVKELHKRRTSGSVLIKKLSKKFVQDNRFYATEPPTSLGWPVGYTGWNEHREWCKSISSVIMHNLKYCNKELYIRAYSGFTGQENSLLLDYTKIRFCEQYYKIADEIINNRGPLIGVHIRRGGHETCIQLNPTDDFYKVMNNEIERNTNVFFVLATDSLEEEKKAREVYGNRIISQGSKDLNTDNISGMQSSIIDLILLSKCSYIIGSETSTYSIIAAKIGGINVIIPHDKKIL